MTTTAVSVVGLGKLGLCLATCFAYKGIRTIGVDVQENIVTAINSGVTPLVEPRMEELVASLGGSMLTATLDHGEAIEKTDITFILTATPSNPDGTFSNAHVVAALTSLARAFGRSEKGFHTFVISSTVVPESINNLFIPLLERESGRRLHDDFDVCFDPDFVALGNVVNDFLNPDLVIIGESRPGAGEQIEAIHRRMCENSPNIARMSLVSAEVAKVSLNAYITVKISFANTLANICEKIPSADLDAITAAIGHDKRISSHYFRGGLSFGGNCFPRDTRAFKAIASRYGIEPEIINAVERVNAYQDRHLAERVAAEVDRLGNPMVSILGLSFKPKTPVITDSPAMKLIAALLLRKISVIVFDPLAMDAVRTVFGERISYAESAESCVKSSDLVVVTTQCPEYRNALEAQGAGRTIFDCWRYLVPERLDAGVRLLKLGYMQSADAEVSHEN